ncbi:MAG: right-handed parallel beta-helix repeat-containing protein [Candidatus Eisenbacteria bacterium]
MRRILLIVLGIILPVCALAGGVRVPGDQPTVQAAVDAAGPGDTVFVGPGTYIENVVIRDKEGITLIGTDGAEETIIDGDEKGIVVQLIQNRGTTTVEGLTLQRGYNMSNGGGLYSERCPVVVRNCRIFDNTGENDGGGISLINAESYLVENCLFERNESIAAAAIGVVGGRGALVRNRVRNNTGGLTISAMFAACDIRENLIVRNLSTGFGFIGYQMSLGAAVEGNTIAMNLGKEDSGAILAQFGDLRISRNLVVNNDGVCGILVESNDGLVRVHRNNVWKNEGGAYKGPEEGLDGISADPLFCSPEKEDFRLRSGSPCLGGKGGGTRIGCFDEGCS